VENKPFEILEHFAGVSIFTCVSFCYNIYTELYGTW